MVIAAVLVGCNTAEQTAETTSPPDTAEALPVDAVAFAVTGEETDPLVVTFSNGDKTVTYIPMIHIATTDFYGAVAEKVKQRKEAGATLYYEFIDFDLLDDDNKRKVRAMVAILPTPEMYSELSGDGHMGQNNDAFLGLVNDKDVNIDMTPMELIEAYEDAFGVIEVTGEDATSDLSEMATTILPPENVSKIAIDLRSQKAASAINNGPDNDIVLLFGAGHGPGIFSELQALDPDWKRTS